jgi:hypothetical protein
MKRDNSKAVTAKQAFATRVIHAGQAPDPSTGAIMPPIYATSTYVQSSPGVHKGLDYGRSHNPTRWAFERCVADLESGATACAFASGLAAISTVLELVDAGAHVVASDDLYGGTFRLFERVRRRSANTDFTFVDLANLDAVRGAIRPETKMLWVETPSNPLLKLDDLAALAQIAREHGLIGVAHEQYFAQASDTAPAFLIDTAAFDLHAQGERAESGAGFVAKISPPAQRDRLVFLDQGPRSCTGRDSVLRQHDSSRARTLCALDQLSADLIHRRHVFCNLRMVRPQALEVVVQVGQIR